MIRNAIVGFVGGAVLTVGAHAAAAKTLDVVASFTVLADVVAQVGGDHVNVVSFVRPERRPARFRAVAERCQGPQGRRCRLRERRRA